MYDSVNPNLPNLLLCIFKNAIQNDINVTLPLSFLGLELIHKTIQSNLLLTAKK